MHCFKSTRRILVVLITLVFSLLPEIGVSLGLGQIKLYSYLNEPLDAEIELMGVEGLTANQLMVSLAPAEDFKKIDLARPYFLSTLRFQVVKQQHRTFIQATSDEAVKQPFLEFLVVITWPEGRLVRGYTLLLDPEPFGDTLKREVKPSSNKTAFNDEKAVHKIQEKFSKNLFSIKSKRVASIERGMPSEASHIEASNTTAPDPNIENFEPLFDSDSEFNTEPLEAKAPIEKILPVSIESSDSTESTESPELIATTTESAPSGKFYENKLLLGSTFGLLFAVALTVWLLKRARESLQITPKFSSPFKDKQVFDEEVIIKLDLAGQYLSIQDHQSAREILDEIVIRGNSQEIERAKALLDKIPS